MTVEPGKGEDSWQSWY